MNQRNFRCNFIHVLYFTSWYLHNKQMWPFFLIFIFCVHFITNYEQWLKLTTINEFDIITIQIRVTAMLIYLDVLWFWQLLLFIGCTISEHLAVTSKLTWRTYVPQTLMFMQIYSKEQVNHNMCVYVCVCVILNKQYIGTDRNLACMEIGRIVNAYVHSMCSKFKVKMRGKKMENFNV